MYRFYYSLINQKYADYLLINQKYADVALREQKKILVLADFENSKSNWNALNPAEHLHHLVWWLQTMWHMTMPSQDCESVTVTFRKLLHFEVLFWQLLS